MPARKINFTAGQVDNSKSHGNYLSQHSDREYEILRDAFLKLGEECDDLRLQVESLSMQYEDSRSDYYKLEAKYHKLEADYNKLQEFYLYNQEIEGYLERLYL